jgi:murein L,D-transpeptidase YafK
MKQLSIKQGIATLAAAVVVATGVFVWAHTPPPPLASEMRVERIVVYKDQRRLLLLDGERPVAEFRVALGRNPRGHKVQDGDERTPEGVYKIDHHKADSDFHKALHISYPSASDIDRARAAAVKPGDSVMIHGLSPRRALLGKLHRLEDWTDGCIAVTNREIEQIFQVVRNGTPIEIRP